MRPSKAALEALAIRPQETRARIPVASRGTAFVGGSSNPSQTICLLAEIFAICSPVSGAEKPNSPFSNEAR